MVSRTLKSYDPLLYHVNNVSDLNKDLVKAHKTGDTAKLRELLNTDTNDYDVFICINKSYHAFVLFAANPKNSVEPLNFSPQIHSDDPFNIPSVLLVGQIELCFENEKLRMYKIRYKMELFKDVKDRVHKSFFIGHYERVPIRAFELSALRASPTRYSVMLEDCVEFAKEYCTCLLSYCCNGRELENQVASKIQLASATGLSAEVLSRRIRSSARFMNVFLGGADVSTWWSEGVRSPLLIVFILIYPIVIAVIVAFVMKNQL